MLTGGAELAMMSTTSNLGVAVRYSLSAGSLLFKIKVEAWTDHGAGVWCCVCAYVCACHSWYACAQASHTYVIVCVQAAGDTEG